MEFIAGNDKAMFATSKGIDVIDLATGNDLLPKMQKFENDADIFTLYRGQYVYNIDAKNRKVYKTDLLSDMSSVIIKDFSSRQRSRWRNTMCSRMEIFSSPAHTIMQLYSPAGELLIDKPFDYRGRGMDRFNMVADKVNDVANTVHLISSLAKSATVLGIGTAAGLGPEAGIVAYEMVAPELEVNRLARNVKAAKYYLSLRRMNKDKATPGSFFVRRNKELMADYLSYVSKSTGEIMFDVPLAEDAKNPEFSISEATGYLYYAPQFVNGENAPYQAMFNAEKLRQAEANNKLGFVAGYEF